MLKTWTHKSQPAIFPEFSLNISLQHLNIAFIFSLRSNLLENINKPGLSFAKLRPAGLLSLLVLVTL